jgi:hypothetical protein
MQPFDIKLMSKLHRHIYISFLIVINLIFLLSENLVSLSELVLKTI